MSLDNSQVSEIATSRGLSQFDILLVAIPLALLAGVVSVLVFSVPQSIGMTLGAAVAACLIGYSVYAITQIEQPQHPQRSHNSSDTTRRPTQ